MKLKVVVSKTLSKKKKKVTTAVTGAVEPLPLFFLFFVLPPLKGVYYLKVYIT